MLDPEQIAQLEAAPGRIVVAYSGGRDSHVLLHALEQLIDHPVEALHINHGLHADADAWQVHVEQVCDELGVPLTSFKVAVSTEGSLEQNARAARYQVFESVLLAGDILLLGHHLDDQLETILLNLMSGRAPLGIQGMPLARPLGRGQLWRPLLNQAGQAVQDYAVANHLNWIEDSSNGDTRHDRNFLRHEVIPTLAERWPGLRHQINDQWLKTRAYLDAMEQEAGDDLRQIQLAPDCLDAGQFYELKGTRQPGLLRAWVRRLGYERVPGEATLQQAIEVLRAPSATFELGELQLQRFRHRLVGLRRSEDDPPAAGGHYSADVIKGRGLSLPLAQLTIGYRQSGEKMLIHGQHKTLKNLFQEQGYPPAVRSLVPLIYDGEDLVGIAAIEAWDIPMVVADGMGVGADEAGCFIDWQPMSTGPLPPA